MSIRSVEEAIGHMGRENVITPYQLNSLNLPWKFDSETPLKIPEKFMNWKGSHTREVRRKLLDTGQMASNIIRNYDIKNIYYPPDKKLHTNDHSNYGYKQCEFPRSKKWWKIWKKDWSQDMKLAKWYNFRRNKGEHVWIVYDEPINNTCPFILIPGVAIDILSLMMKFPNLIDEYNHPYHWLFEQEPKTGTRRVEDRWYLIYKYPDRSRFANKDRYQQNALLRYPEEWAYLCEALYATTVYRMIHKKNILTDYTLTKDMVCLIDGKRTAMLRNFKCHENNTNRGQIQLSQDPWFHGHRNTVPFVVIKV